MDSTQDQFNIAAVERQTGLSRETLRIWERRYGFPKPGRNAVGDRVFSPAEVERLLFIKRLLEMGYRPGRVVPLPLEELRALDRPAEAARGRKPPRRDTRLAEYLRLLAEARLDALQSALEHSLVRLGLAGIIRDVVAPLTEAVGEAWLKGELSVRDEHAYTELLRRFLRRTLDKLPRAPGGPRILMTTPAGELHGLGLLMAECLLVLEGADCLSLGVNLPNGEIAAAARAHRARIVALSISAAYPRRLVGGTLRDLRGLLDAEVEIWAGGLAMQHLRLPAGVTRCVKLDDLGALLEDWRRRHPGEGGLAP